MKEYLVFEKGSYFELEERMYQVNAQSAEDAIAKYWKEIYIPDVQYLFETKDEFFAEDFWPEGSSFNSHNDEQKGQFKKKVRQLLETRPDLAEIYLDFMFSDAEKIVHPESNELLYRLSMHCSVRPKIIAIDLQQIPRIEAH